MPLGLTNAPETLQRLMNTVLCEFLDKFLRLYLDELLVYSKSLQEYVHHLRLVLDKFWTHKCVLKCPIVSLPLLR